MKTQIVILEKSQLSLIYMAGKITNLIMRHEIYPLHGIYGGKIDRMVPSLDAAFVTLYESARNGFLQSESLKNTKKPKQKHYIGNNQIVQIRKEPTGNKGPRLTTKIMLNGRYSNLFPFGETVNIGKGTIHQQEKNYIKALGHLMKPKYMGVELKDQSTDTKIEFLLRESKILKSRWQRIIKRAKHLQKPSLISRPKGIRTTTIEHWYSGSTNYITIDSQKSAKEIYQTIAQLKRKQKLTIEYDKNSNNLIVEYYIDKDLSNFIVPKIKTTNGAYIVIEKTEALTTIDVNSGVFVESNNSKTTSFWTNYTAITEIVNQIKIRNIGGIIIIDFIHSNNQDDQIKILAHLYHKLKTDVIPSTIVQLSELGLVEITRARQGQNIYDALSNTCLLCNGLGYTPKFTFIDSSNNVKELNQLLPIFSNDINKQEQYNRS